MPDSLIKSIFLQLSLITGFTSCTDVNSLCDNLVIKEISSPNGKNKIIEFTRDCGATTEESIHLSVISTSDSLSNVGGNIFVSTAGHANDIKKMILVKWANDSTIEIKYDSTGEVFKKLNNRNSIRIIYEKSGPAI